MPAPTKPFSISRAFGGWLAKFVKIGQFAVTNYEKKDGLNVPIETLQFEKVYGADGWTYACIYAIASAAAGLPLKVFEKSADGELEEIPDHALLHLIEEPNPFMSGYDLIELMVIFLESTGNSYWLLDNGDKKGLAPGQTQTLKDVKEIWPMPSHQVKIIPGQDTLITEYEFKPMRGAKGLRLAVSEVLQVRYANPLSLYHGQGSVEAGKGAILANIYQEQFNNAFFKNGAIPPAFIETEQVLTREQMDEFKAQWSLNYQGIRNAHKLAILHAGLKFSIPKFDMREMQFVELAKWAKAKIMAVTGVPPVMIGDQEAKYDNAEQQKQVFWENTMLPKLRKIENALTQKLRQLGEPDNLYVKFDTSKVKALQENYQVQAETAKSWWEMGYPINGLIRIFGPSGMEEIEEGDVGFIPTMLQTVEQAVAPEPIEPEGTPEDAPPPGSKPKPGKPKPGDSSNLPEEGAPQGAEGDLPVDTDKGIKASDKRLDDYHWKRFIAQNEPGFRKMRGELKRVFAAQRKIVLRKISAHYKPTKTAPGVVVPDIKASVEVYLIDVHDETKKMQKATRQTIGSIYDKAGKQAVADSGVGIAFDVESTNAINFMNDRSFRFSFEVNKTTVERLRRIIGEKIGEGATQSELTDRIKEEFDFYERYRAARIARTESGIAGNAGIQEGFEQAGVEGKRWISSRDEKVRDSHAVADGEEVDVNEPFDVGGSLLDHPGDPDGPPEEIINCRCTMRGIVNRS